MDKKTKTYTRYEFQELISDIDINKLNIIIAVGNRLEWDSYENMEEWVKRYYNIRVKA